MHRFSSRLIAIAALAVAVVAASCSGTDDGATVREIGDGSESVSASASGSGSASGSASASATGSASATATGSATGTGSASATATGSASATGTGSASASAPADGSSESSPGDGGYEYASNVDSHRLLVADICGIGGLLDAGDFAAVEDIYRNGENSVKSDGSIRTIGGFAAGEGKKHGLDAYYGTPTPLDDFVTAALQGTGMFEGQSDGVRSQGAEKGIQNQVMVAYAVHELYAALAKAQEGNFDVASGAVHNWDEGWAFFHGTEPGCSPYATGNKRAGNFGTVGADGETAQANEAILAAMIAGRDALLASDAAGAEAATEEVVRGLAITYSQAAIRYASLIEGDLADGNDAKAKEHQAEGLAFWRVIEAYMVPEGADADAMDAIFNLNNPPGANGYGVEVRAALEPAWDALGIAASDIGSLQ